MPMPPAPSSFSTLYRSLSSITAEGPPFDAAAAMVSLNSVSCGSFIPALGSIPWAHSSTRRISIVNGDCSRMSKQCSKIGTIPIMTLQCRRLLGVLFFLLVFHSLCDAAFRVYLKDGASKQVSRIYFNGPKVDLYQISGVKMTVSRADIDYERSGFKEPEAAVGVSIYGTHEAPNKEASRRPAYEDLESLWNSAKQKAVASKDFGTITKGQEVRVIGSDAISYTIIAREQDGGYTRRVVDSETFFDFFESSLEKK